MTVLEIVKEYLEKNGFDGLVSPGDCGCELSDLAPCCVDIEGCECEPAYKIPCPNIVKYGGCEFGCGEGDWHMTTEKPEENDD